MKIGLVGIELPLGKQILNDLRLEKLKSLFHSQQTIPLQIEILAPEKLKEAEVIICDKNEKITLVLSDLEIIESYLLRQPTNELFLRCKDALEKEIVLSEIPFNNEEKKLLSNLNLNTLKSITFLDKNNLPPFDELLLNVYRAAEKITFFTANERQVRAWSIKKGTTVYEASGLIHSDIQKGFIKAEVINYEELIKAGSLSSAKARGLLRLEDKEYVVKEGDLIQIRFNV